ncbi:MAG: hypothetical protein US15_C0020G0008 [Candidatus Moranbacteria bacterium GW2011_GWF1_36_4]|nr:MAG: hypothetical protein US15_C0020G0008 [Candidatus Moranbacteria bacterium GW2011_GWF1_36_4]
MKKNHKILVSIGIVILLVIVTVGVVFQVNKGKSYATAISFIKVGQWFEANEVLYNLNGYKNTDILLEYTDVLRIISEENPSPDYVLNYYFSTIPENYKGDLSKEINEHRAQLKQKADAVKQKEIDPEQQKYNSGINYLNSGDYNKAGNIFYELSHDNQGQYLNPPYKDSVQKISLSWGLFHYQEWLNGNKSDEEKAKSAALSLYYAEKTQSSFTNYSSSVNELWKQAKIDLKNYWQYAEEAYIKDQKILEYKSKPEPRIGMTANEVINSRWGKPTKVNKTTTAYSVSEQWVYSSSRYVYLKDGIVEAIQD